MYKKKNNKDVINAVVDSLEKGYGRIQSCRNAGICYQTFLNWMNPEHASYNLDFLEAVKKAEKKKLQERKEVCESIIMQVAVRENKEVWQAAAWMLERTFPNEYGVKHNIDHTSKGEAIKQTIIVSSESSKSILEQLDAAD